MPSNSDGPPSAQARRLTVTRCLPGDNFGVIFLADGPILGLITHWLKGSSQRCFGDTCLPCRSNMDKVWKGYAPAIFYVKAEKHWLPTVLEVSESLELDLRGIVRRGQEWHLTRALAGRKRKPPTIGRWIRQLHADSLPPAFPTDQAVRVVYHDNLIETDVPSPLAARSMVEPLQLNPHGLPDKEQAPSVEEIARRREQIARLISQPRTNGIGAMPEGGKQ